MKKKYRWNVNTFLDNIVEPLEWLLSVVACGLVFYIWWS